MAVASCTASRGGSNAAEKKEDCALSLSEGDSVRLVTKVFEKKYKLFGEQDCI
jgi:hypothetical protein